MKRKLGKLVAETADVRILLLERLMIPMACPPESIGQAVETLRRDFPNLEKIDEIWMAYTGAWEREDVVWYRRAWYKGSNA